MRHDSYPEAYLAEILHSAKTVAIVGASVDTRRPSHWIAGFLLGKGYRVFPVNPKYAGQIMLGQPVYAKLADIPVDMDVVDVFRRADQFAAVVEEILRLPELPRAIWGQLGVRDDAAASRAESAGIRVVMDRALVSEYPLVYELQHASRPRSAA
ncbi:CoA-binding protein [Rhizobium sp. ACO-34A]|nr:CoA-binding protein [Rhizobium sp. ACO-34A]ATN33934.1 CoA-binding protein [Rhizobium sp. ACO-34A]